MEVCAEEEKDTYGTAAGTIRMTKAGTGSLRRNTVDSRQTIVYRTKRAETRDSEARTNSKRKQPYQTERNIKKRHGRRRVDDKQNIRQDKHELSQRNKTTNHMTQNKRANYYKHTQHT